MAVSGGLGGSGDGIGLSDIRGILRKHLSSILSIHLFSFAVGEWADVTVASRVFSLWILGDSDRERLPVLMPADRSLMNISRSDAGDMKYAKGSESILSLK